MFVIVIIAVFLILQAAIIQQSATAVQSFETYQSSVVRSDIAALMESVVEARNSGATASYVDPQSLLSVNGYEFLRFRNIPRYQFRNATGINDGYWRFDRSVIWFESPHSAVGNNEYTTPTYNTCGDDGLMTSSNWCGRTQSIWVREESKTDYAAEILGERQRLYRTISKFYRRFEHDQALSTSTPGTVATLASLAGYAGVASNCSGIYLYNAIPLNCSDMFNAWGIPVVLNVISAKHVALVNRTTISSAAGQFVRLAEEANLE